jgi:4-aminobutyrate aminotransferase-like enzyme
MAAGIATLDVLESDGLIDNAARTGDYLMQGLAAMRRATSCCERCAEKG